MTGDIVPHSRCDVTIGYNNLIDYKSIVDYNKMEFKTPRSTLSLCSDFFIPLHLTSNGPMVEIYQSSSHWKSLGPLTTHRFLGLISTFHSRNYISPKMAEWIRINRPNIRRKDLTVVLPCGFVVNRRTCPSAACNPDGLFLWNERINFTIKAGERSPLILGNSFFSTYQLILDFGNKVIGIPNPPPDWNAVEVPKSQFINRRVLGLISICTIIVLLACTINSQNNRLSDFRDWEWRMWFNIQF